MATTYDDIVSLVLVSIQDYKINKLYADSPSDFNDYMDGFLLRAIPLFSNCAKDLSDRNDNTRTFNITLTDLEKSILANLTVIEWYSKEINDVTQFNNFLSDTDYKMFSNANNLKEKRAYKNELVEQVNQQMTTYGIKNVPWTDWAAGTYGS